MKKPILKIVITHVTVSPNATLSGPASESVSCVLSLLTVCAVGVRVCDSWSQAFQGTEASPCHLRPLDTVEY